MLDNKQMDLFMEEPYKKDAHTEHCCSEHGNCKYGDDDCPVANKIKPASWPCNCDWM